MLRTQPVGLALSNAALAAFASDWAQTPAHAAWHEAICRASDEYHEPVAEACYWPPGRLPPLQHVSTALTIENALWQRNLLLQCGVGYEHVGMLVIYGQYSGKGASLQAVMPAVWASAEYAKLAEKKRALLDPSGLRSG